jgi:hypothetical protein
MGWASATQRDPEAALVTVDGLHTLLAHLAHQPAPGSGLGEGVHQWPIVYQDNTVPEALLALANVAVGAIEGGQHQTCAQVFNVFAMVIPRLSERHQRVATAQVRHALTTVTRHPVTAELQNALAGLGGVLSDNGHRDVAAALAHVESQLDDELPRA